MPEEDAKARLGKAFRLRELTYRPLRALPYEDAKIDWDTGRVTLRRLPRDPFTPTLTAAEFFSHFLSSNDSPGANTTAQPALCAGDSAQAAPRPRIVADPDSIPLMEAVHDLRTIRGTDLRSAISEMIDILATGQLPPADALVDDVPAKIDPRWWWVGTIEYPNSSAAFNLIIDGEVRFTRVTEIALDCGAWKRQRSRITAVTQHERGPFPHWDDPTWDRPVLLPDAIRLWLPSLARRLDQLTPPWPSPDEIRNMAQQREIRNLALQARGGNKVAEAPGGDPDDMDDPAIPASLRDEWARLLRQWDQWDVADRVVHACEMAGQLIIEKTRRGQPYFLICAPGTSRGDLRIDYTSLDQTLHDTLGPYDFYLPTSYLRLRGANWFARISGGSDAEAERMRGARLQREATDAAAGATWATILGKPFRERGLFGFLEIAEHLTRKSVVDAESAKRDIVVLDLDDWTKRQEFDLTGESDVVIRIEEPPFFRPLGPAEIAGVSLEPEVLRIHNAQFVYLRRPACRRYIEANLALENAPRLLRDWFPEAEEEGRSGGLYADANRHKKARRANRQRAAYRDALEVWMAQQELSVLQRVGAAAISRQFSSYCGQHLPEVMPLLPNRLRSMENLIERIIKRRLAAARTKSRGQKPAENRQ